MNHHFLVRQVNVGGFDHNFSYLIQAENGDCALIDPCGSVELLKQEFLQLPVPPNPRYFLLTHGHPDHWDGLSEARLFFPAPVAASGKINTPPVDLPLEDEQRLPFGEHSFFKAIATPGHSSDSICYALSDDSALFSGDTLFIGCCGFCKPKLMFQSLHQKLFPLPDSMLVYSGHDYGDVPVDTLGHQKQNNPYLAAADYASFYSAWKQLK